MIKEGDLVLIDGFIEGFCKGKEQNSNTWAHWAYMAEIERRPVKVQRRTGSNMYKLSDEHGSAVMTLDYIKKYHKLEGAEEI